MNNNWSTKDFLPGVCCIFIGLVVGQIVQSVLLERVLAIESEAVVCLKLAENEPSLMLLCQQQQT